MIEWNMISGNVIVVYIIVIEYINSINSIYGYYNDI